MLNLYNDFQLHVGGFDEHDHVIGKKWHHVLDPAHLEGIQYHHILHVGHQCMEYIDEDDE